MSDDTESGVVKRALKRRKQLVQEMERIDTFLAMYAEFSGESFMTVNATHVAASAADESPVTARDDDTKPPRLHLPFRLKSGGLSMSLVEFTKIVREILIKNGMPMTRDAILDEIHKMGRHLPGNESSNIKSKLWRAKDAKALTVIAGAGFWPADVPCPAVRYEPSELDLPRHNDLAGDRT